MENLNAEKIKKALECCGSNNPCGEECFGHDIKGLSECTKILAQNALALINSQEQRIKELTEDLHASYTELTRVQEENERLRANAKSATEILNFKFAYDAGKADGVRKVAERFKKRFKYLHGVIDQVTKEVLEGEKSQ